MLFFSTFPILIATQNDSKLTDRRARTKPFRAISTYYFSIFAIDWGPFLFLAPETTTEISPSTMVQVA